MTEGVDASELVVLTTGQIQGLDCAHCGLLLVTAGPLGTYFVADQDGQRHLADLFVCTPTCKVAARLREPTARGAS